MSTFRIGNLRRTSLLLSFAVAVAAARITGCKNANDVTGVVNPAPGISVAGAWVGTFTPAEPAFYYSDPYAAHANLQQTGTSFDGTITISGSPAITIHATISGNQVNGTIEDASGSGTAVGLCGATHLSLTLHPHAVSAAGTLRLHR